MQPTLQTTLYIALALSPGSKAITTLPRGTHILVERDVSDHLFNCVFISEDRQNSTSYFALNETDLFDQLRIDGIINHQSVWSPVTDALAQELLSKEKSPINEVRELLIEALQTNDARRKQWYLWCIADTLDIDVYHISADVGIEP